MSPTTQEQSSETLGIAEIKEGTLSSGQGLRHSTHSSRQHKAGFLKHARLQPGRRSTRQAKNFFTLDDRLITLEQLPIERDKFFSPFLLSEIITFDRSMGQSVSNKGEEKNEGKETKSIS